MNEESGREIIYIQRIEMVGEIVPDPFGSKPMVVKAFEVAGEYLDHKASQGREEHVEVQFDYQGVTFRAGYGIGGRNDTPEDFDES